MVDPRNSIKKNSSYLTPIEITEKQSFRQRTQDDPHLLLMQAKFMLKKSTPLPANPFHVA
jgi:hypothetical protein